MTENNDKPPDTPSEKIGEIVSIFERGERWYANFQVDGKQHRRSLKTTSKKQARQLAIRLEADILEGRHREAAKAVTIDKAVEVYLAHQRTEGRAAKTIAKIELTCRRLKELAQCRKVTSLAAVNLTFVDAYRAVRVAAGAKPKTVHNETVILRQLVNFAVRRELLNNDPLRGMRLKRPKPSRQPCWTRHQVDLIVGKAGGPHLSSLVLLAETGMRVGELKHLTWEDVDFERGVLHIRPKEGWQPKSGDQRAVPMSAAARELLTSLPRHALWVVTAAASKLYPDGRHQISERRLLQYLQRILKRLGLPGHLHTFRHSFISHALTKGTPEAVVRSWVGHVDQDVLKLYTHIADQASQAAMQRLDAASAAVVPPSGNGPQDQ
ncbi:MAG: tyrosine-type recombinase/integrase [Pirellulales bacterium]